MPGSGGCGRYHLGQTGLLGAQSMSLGDEIDELGNDDGVISPHRSVVEKQERLAGTDACPIPDEYFTDNAAVPVLYLLDLVDHGKPAAGDNRAVQSRRRGPASEAADQQNADQQAAKQFAPDRGSTLSGLRHSLLAAHDVATLTGPRSRSRRIWLRGPKAACRPFAMTST